MASPGLQSLGIEKIGRLEWLENVDIELTNQCNFNCSYCYVNKDQTTHLDSLALRRVFDYCNRNRVKSITLTGGEPFLYEHFGLLYELIQGSNANVTFFTNGSLLEQTQNEYNLSSVSICLKRDFVHDKSQSHICGISRMPYKFFELVPRLRERFKEITLHSALTSENFKELPQLYEVAKRMDISHYISRVVPSNEEARKIMPTKDMCVEVFSKIAEIEGKKISIPFVGEIGCIKMYCSIFVDRFGIIHPCSNLPFEVGSVSENVILSSGKINEFRNIRRNLKGKCGSCVDNHRCYGCRGIAYHLTGNYLASDPLCWRE